MSLLHSFAKRAADTIEVEIPSWGWIIFLIDALILIPVFIFVQYTITYVFPVFAIIENENPPAYDPIDISEDASPSPPLKRTLPSPKRLLKAHGGFRALFRGLFCAVAISVMTSFITLFYSNIPYATVASLVASLVLAQFSAAWVHIIITPQSPLPFWRRLPGFSRALTATWRPIILDWAAIQVAQLLPLALGLLMGVDFDDVRFAELANVSRISRIGNKETVYLTKCLIITLFSTLLHIFAVIPAKVILIRIQASLLPAEQDTIIPFDRSFDGKVEPAVVGGRGWASISDAWSTFSPPAGVA
ncbi:hypothetical protein PT974_00905 [Cladobotryum mycophilum]|uniref:Ubiquitin carrier protein n=1 Tax=Cladobotryum mycophilum TaxID=491253 RepID=A0ABR0T3G6_9HYPO